MLVSNVSGEHARRASRLSLSVIVTLVLCAVGAQAQTDPARQSQVGERPASIPASNAKRARRASQTPAENDASTVKNSPASSEAETGAASSATQETTVAADDPEESQPLTSNETGSTDRLETLRAKIKAAKNEGERARVRRMLIDYLVAMNKKDEALKELHAMAQEERFDPVSFYNIGNALARLGDDDGAIEAYHKAIEQRRGNYSRALNNLGVVLLRRGRLDEAYEALASALRLENFRYAEASYNLGRLYTVRGETQLAIREWTSAINAQPDHADAALALARAYAQAGSPERSLAILDAYTNRHGPSSEFETARREVLASAAASGKKISATKKTSGGGAPSAAGKDSARKATRPSSPDR